MYTVPVPVPLTATAPPACVRIASAVNQRCLKHSIQTLTHSLTGTSTGAGTGTGAGAGTGTSKSVKKLKIQQHRVTIGELGAQIRGESI